MVDNEVSRRCEVIWSLSIGSGSVELSHEQMRAAFLKFVPALITEVEILDGMKELKMELEA